MVDFAKLILGVDTRGLKEGERDLNRFAQSSRSAATTVSAGMVRIGKSISAAVGLGIGIGSVIRTNVEFGASMSRVAAISGATAQELEQLRGVAIQMGADTAFSASQAADALGFLAMAGFSAAEAMEAIPDVLALAAASGMDLASAADIASNVISGFGKNASDAAQVSDVLAKAASSTNTNVFQLGQAMSTAAPIAAALGISMEETAAAIGVMSDAGIQGERAGTALRGIFASLAGPTEQAREALAKYGLSAAEIDPQTVGLANAMKTLRDANVSTADAFIIFGREAASGALVMAETADRIEDLTGQFENAEGAAQQMAAVMRDNLAGDIDELTGSIDTMIIKLGDAGVTGALRSMAQFGTTAVNAVSGSMGRLISIVATLASGFAAYRGTLFAVTVAQSAYTAAMVAATRVIGAAQVGAIGLNAALAANPFGAVALAVGVLTSAFVGLSQAQKQARAETDNLIRSLEASIKARGADVASARATADLERQRAQDRLDLLEGQLAKQKGAGAGYAAQALGQEITDLRWEVIQYEATVRLANRTLKEMEGASESIVVPTAQAADSVGKLSKELREGSSAAKDAAEAFQSLYDRLRPLEAAERQLEADRKLIQSRKDLTQATKDELIALLELESYRERTSGLGPAKVSEGLLKQGSLAVGNNDMERSIEQINAELKATKVLKETGDVAASLKILKDAARDSTQSVAESFGQMADRTIQSLERMISAIRGGNFLDILSSVLNVGLQLAGMGAFGKGAQNFVTGKRADGGQVNAGRTYLVGERGPELFSPATNGQIVANDNMRGSGMVINVDARGSSDPEAVRQQVERGILEAAPAIVAAAQQRTITTLRRPKLAGAL